MRLGIFTFPASIEAFIARSKEIAEAGFPAIWVPQIFGLEALSAIAVAGSHVPNVRFGTAVVPTYPRHPMTLAQEALTAQMATGGRVTLGIGLSHKVVIEGMFGMSYDKPARHMREYLSILLPLLREKKVNFTGDTLTFRGQVEITAEPCPVVIAALAPMMLKLAGEVADGTSLWMTGPRTIEEYIRPTMLAAATGRPTPLTIAGLPVCLTNDPEAARAKAAKEFAVYGQLPSYRAVLDREGAAGPADIGLIGDEATVAAGIRRMAEAGTDDFMANIFGTSEEQSNTFDFLKTLL